MKPKGMAHPSARPIRINSVVGRPMWRIPDEGPATPRLREERRDLNLVGFMHSYHEADDDE